ncbi:TetR/AcrR family transcriptional regulator [Rhodococcus qingshengii]|uniref:TetR/AcrR family transcriptional regulator n=1 Tax=Rhodococcus qingshengii TaxID=334542 RepID=UPI0036D80022
MPDNAAPTARDRILDAAANTMRDRGLARATTKEIAAVAGYSEAMIYKLFDDKVDLFLSVLRERVPTVDILTHTDRTPGDASTFEDRLVATIEQITAFYRQTFAIGASLFSDAELLERHRTAVMAQGAGPALLPAAVAQFLQLEQRNGTIAAGAPINGAASSIAGACYLRAFLEQFYGPEHQQEPMADFTTSIVATVLPALITAQYDF